MFCCKALHLMPALAFRAMRGIQVFISCSSKFSMAHAAVYMIVSHFIDDNVGDWEKRKQLKSENPRNYAKKVTRRERQTRIHSDVTRIPFLSDITFCLTVSCQCTT
jgi:hypothetical protein